MHLVWLFLLFGLAAYAEPVILEDEASVRSFTLQYAPNIRDASEIQGDTLWQTASNKVHIAPKKEYWYRLTLNNPTPAAQSRVLLFTETNIEHIDLYRQTDQQSVVQRSGAAVSIDHRGVKSHLMAFRVSVPPYGQAVYDLRIYSLLPSFEEILLLSEEDFSAYEKNALLIYMAYFGVLLTTLVYSLIIALTTKEKILMVNTLYLFFSLLQKTHPSGHP